MEVWATAELWDGGSGSVEVYFQCGGALTSCGGVGECQATAMPLFTQEDGECWAYGYDFGYFACGTEIGSPP